MHIPSPVRAIRRHGLFGTARIAFQKITTKSHPAEKSSFDATTGLDTDGDDSLEGLSIAAPAAHILHGNRYQATSPEMFAKVMAVTPIEPGMTFIDIGSGKGRALLMAASYPFKRIIGVEFAAELHQVAEANIRRFASPTPIESVCADALTWEFPNEPSVVYVYNSFGRPLMKDFVERLEQSVREQPRPLVVVYRNPTCQDLWARWAPIHTDPMFLVLQPPA